jgi:hypothetical protein
VKSVVRKSLLGVAAAISISIATSLPAQAGITFDLGNNPQPDEENILLNQGTNGSNIIGVTNMSGLDVMFSSTTDMLSDPPMGQARIEAEDGALNNLSIYVMGGSYHDLILNPFNGEGAAFVSVLTNQNVYNFNYNLGNGQNFLTLFVDAGGVLGGERILNTTINSAGGFDDLRQPRISGAQLDRENPNPNPVPEPGTMALLGLGAAPLLRRLRRKSADATETL